MLPIGLVLAGGRGLRLGQAKAGLCLADGENLAQHAARALAGLTRGVLISVARGGWNPAPGHVAIEDREADGPGPLAGIHAAFEATERADLLVLACDYPLVESALLARLTAASRSFPEDDVVLICDGSGRDHPLVALWRRRAAERLGLALDQGRRKVQDLVAQGGARRLGAADFAGFDLDRLLLNLNEPADLERLRPPG